MASPPEASALAAASSSACYRDRHSLGPGALGPGRAMDHAEILHILGRAEIVRREEAAVSGMPSPRTCSRQTVRSRAAARP